MLGRRARIVAALAMWASGAAAQGVRQTGATDVAAVKAELSAVLGKYVGALVKGDSKTIAAFYTADAIHTYPTTHRGNEAIERAWAGWMRLYRWDNVKIEPEDVEVRGDMAFEMGVWTQSYTTVASGAPSTQRLRYTVWWKRQADGQWKLYRWVGSSGG